jgi:hypothetical protein
VNFGFYTNKQEKMTGKNKRWLLPQILKEKKQTPVRMIWVLRSIAVLDKVTV